jgi:hypothetical protein
MAQSGELLKTWTSSICFHIFFNFYGCCSPWRTLASFLIARHWPRSCAFRLQFLTPIVFRSSSTESSHLTAGLPPRRLPHGSAHFCIRIAHSGFPLISPWFRYIVLDVSVRLQLLKASQQLRRQPHAQPVTWRTRVSLFVCIITFDLYSMGDPTSSYDTAGIPLRIVLPCRPHHYVKVGILVFFMSETFKDDKNRFNFKFVKMRCFESYLRKLKSECHTV